MAKVIVTGGTGFIGKELIEELNKRNIDFLSLARDIKKIQSSRIDKFVMCELDSPEVSDFIEEGDIVVHLAALAHGVQSEDINWFNVDVTTKFAQVAAENRAKRFIFLSSIGVNGNVTKEQPFTSNSSPNPVNSYAKSKYEAELNLQRLTEGCEMELVIIRPTLVYGVNAPGNFGLLVKLVQVLPILPFGLFNNKRDFIALANLVDLIISCISHPKAKGKIFLAADGEQVSTKDFTNAIAKGIGKYRIQVPIPIRFFDFSAKLIGKRKIFEQLYGDLQVDISETRRVLGWVAPYSMSSILSLLSDVSKDKK